jgi:hypothetical protein
LEKNKNCRASQLQLQVASERARRQKSLHLHGMKPIIDSASTIIKRARREQAKAIPIYVCFVVFPNHALVLGGTPIRGWLQHTERNGDGVGNCCLGLFDDAAAPGPCQKQVCPAAKESAAIDLPVLPGKT